jgi:non-specific serine/threonine protein kinase
VVLRVQFFGEFRVWRDQEEVTLLLHRLGKPKPLLKILLAHPHRLFTQDELAEWLWPEMPRDAAIVNVRKRVSELRQVLEPQLDRGSQSQYILSKRESGYYFSPQARCETDTQEFLQKWDAGQRLEQAGQYSLALREYEAAEALVRGDFLAEDRYEDWAQALQAEWEERLLNLLERVAECHARLGQYDRALDACQKSLQRAPTRESVYRRQMLYFYLKGEPSQSLEAYQVCLHVLNERLEVKPSTETQELYQRIVEHNVPELPRVIPHNLPRSLTSFLGREQELTQIKWALQQTRLMTLTGAGGCGKTRLALEVAGKLLNEYPDGVWWVELAALSNPYLVPSVVASALGLKDTAGRSISETLTSYLRPKNLLLILDNCEHLVRACGQLAESLLKVSPQLQILPTSREALGLGGETVWPVPPLATPRLQPLPTLKVLEQYGAVSLFVERAMASQPSFRLTRKNAMAVAQICTHLDGIPLAIEMAAARVRVLSVEQIAERLSERFQLLTAASATAYPHHQTLRATMDWSYQLLTKKEQGLLRRFSVFAGEFSLEDVGPVCAGKTPGVMAPTIEATELLNLISHLVDKSLIFVTELGLRARYRMLETVRQYAREKLCDTGEAQIIYERHLDYCVTLAKQAFEAWYSPDEPRWYDRLDQAHDDLRAALAWALEQRKTESALLICKGIWQFWLARGHRSEAREWIKKALDQSHGLRTELYARVLNAAGRLACERGDYTEAREFHEQTMSIYQELGDKRGVGSQYVNLGVIASYQSNHRLACSLYEQAVPVFRELGNRVGLANALANMGMAAGELGDYALARARLEEALQLRRELGDQQSIAYELGWLAFIAQQEEDYEQAMALRRESLAIFRTLNVQGGIAGALEQLGWIAFVQRDYQMAHVYYEEALEIHKKLGDKKSIAYELGSIAELILHEGDLDRAPALYLESLALHYQLGVQDGLSRALRGLACVAVCQKQFERAARLFGAAEALHESIGARLNQRERAEREKQLALPRDILGPDRFTKLWNQGKAMPLDEAVQYAQDHHPIG